MLPYWRISHYKLNILNERCKIQFKFYEKKFMTNYFFVMFPVYISNFRFLCNYVILAVFIHNN